MKWGTLGRVLLRVLDVALLLNGPVYRIRELDKVKAAKDVIEAELKRP